MKVYVVFDTFDYMWGIYETYNDAQTQADEIKFAYVEEINVVPSSSSGSSQQSCQTEQSSYSQCGSGIPGDMWE